MWPDVEGKQESFGEYLKRERELRHITLDEVSKATKIRKFYLDAIERDEYALLPAIPYLKGFVRAYAKYIGIDPDDAILRLESTLKQFEARKTPAPVRQRNRYKTSQLYIALTVVLIIVAVILIRAVRKEEQVKTVSQVKKEEQLPKAIVKEEEKKGVAPEEQEKETPKQEPIKINIRAKEKTWVMVRRDDEKPFDVILWEGDVANWYAERRISLRIGNAQGVEIIYNGIPLKNLGAKGEVVGIVLPDDLPKFQ